MKKTRILTMLLIAAIVVAVCVFALPTQADAATSGKYTYEVTNGEATITDCDESISGNITIPSKLGGYPVTAIGDFAFYECTGLTNVTIPNGVTSIGHWAFGYCTSLTSVTIPNSVTSIGNSAFSRCSSLTSVAIPNSVTNIGQNPFSSCDKLPYTVYGNAKYLGNDSNPYLCLVEAVSNDITTVNIVNGVKVIVGGAFYDCNKLTSVVIPNSVTSIGDRAFFYCRNMTSVTLGNGITSIGYGTFDHCYGLTSIKIPDGVTSIGDYAFYDCESLTTVSIPASVTTIEDYTFCGCDNLSNVYYSGTEAQWRKISIGKKNENLVNAKNICYNVQPVKLTKQPASVTVAKGQTAKATVAATGDGLTYTWYYKNAGASSFSKSSVAKATYAVTMDANVKGRQVYCVVKDKYGNSVKSNTVTLSMGKTLKITTQPKSVNVTKGYAAKVTVAATGDGLIYTWYYKNAGASSFSKSSVTKATYGVTMDAKVNGRQVYCVVKDKYGISVKSSTVTLSMKQTAKITTQPKSVTVAKGYAAKVTVVATGDGLTYTWYYKNAGATSFSKSSVTKATYGATMDAKVNGRQVYCVVKDKYGNSVKSSTVTLSMKQTAKITTQPTSVTVSKGRAAKVTVVASGDGLTYTWYYKNAGASSFSKSSVAKATYGVTMDAKVNGRQVYCVVADKYGNTVKSSTVTLKMK